MEEVAVVVVAGELGLERRLELERRRGGLQLGVDVLVAANRGHAVELLHAVVLHLLAVLARHHLLLGVRVALVATHCAAIVCAAGGGRGGGASRVLGVVGVVVDEAPRAENSTIRQFATKVRCLAPAWRGSRWPCTGTQCPSASQSHRAALVPCLGRGHPPLTSSASVCRVSSSGRLAATG